jgi:lipoprotein-anchoring transpeptidase ErfK/SrfK
LRTVSRSFLVPSRHHPHQTANLDRRALLGGVGAMASLALAGCSRTADMAMVQPLPPAAPVAPQLAPVPPPSDEQTASIKPDEPVDRELEAAKQMYRGFTDEGFALPAIPVAKLNRKHLRKEVADPTGEAPGTIVVHLRERHLYLVLSDGVALRYGVSIGKEGFSWSGRAVVNHTKKWPTWTPPAEMVARKPSLAKYASGQPGGLDNPLGARALYIYQDGRDTLYRIHGTPEWNSIGKAASSGCVRMINQDVIDLYDRVSGRGKVPIVVVP